jgi:hypothetical protein
MTAFLRSFAAIVGFVPALASAAGAHAPVANATSAPAKPVHVERLRPNVATAMRATLNPDGTLSYQCIEQPRARQRNADVSAPDAPRQER